LNERPAKLKQSEITIQSTLENKQERVGCIYEYCIYIKICDLQRGADPISRALRSYGFIEDFAASL